MIVGLWAPGAEVADETADYLNAHGEKVGVLKVHLYRPFSVQSLLAGAAEIGQEPGRPGPLQRTRSAGEPFYQDIVTAIAEGEVARANRGYWRPYGLSSKEFTPAMAKAVFDEMKSAHPKNHFTIGINDDVSTASLDFDSSFDIEIAGNRALPVRWPGSRRHGGRQQEFDQDHRRRNR